MSSFHFTAPVRFVAAVALLVSSASAADDSAVLPVTVTVAANHAYRRCGPGDDHYPTERLSVGTEVEVWAVDASGYCAVRPLRSSFSWMLARDVQAESTSHEGAASGGRTTLSLIHI